MSLQQDATDSVPNEDTDAGVRSSRSAASRIGSIAAIVIVVAVVAWIVAGRMNAANDTLTPSPSTSASTAAIAASGPALASKADILAAAARVGHAVYWAGEIPNTSFELTVASTGAVFVRYLPKGAMVGSKTPYLTVATYPDANAYANIRAAAGKAGTVSVKYAGGAFAVAGSDAASNVNFAFEGAPIQIEVFAPEPGKAWSLIEAGTIAQIL